MSEECSTNGLAREVGDTIRRCRLVGRVEGSDISRVWVGTRGEMVDVYTIDIGLPVKFHLEGRLFLRRPAEGEILVVDAVLRLSHAKPAKLLAEPFTVATVEGDVLWQDQATLQEAPEGVDVLKWASPNLGT